MKRFGFKERFDRVIMFNMDEYPLLRKLIMGTGILSIDRLNV